MPGMGSTTISTTNVAIVDAFKNQLLHQGLIVVVLLALLAIAWNALRATQLRRSLTGTDSPSVETSSEPAARRVLRVAFALLWLVDGMLQAQTAMPVGMPVNVLTPSAATSPAWVRSLVHTAALTWSNHPVVAATSAVWIQCGIGLLLLVAPRGTWSRLAGAASAGWAVVVWVFGEAFGGIFAPGLTWLFGAPGAVVFYAAAGVLVAMPERVWATDHLGRAIVRAIGAFDLAMAVLQAWPGRGFWHGRLPHGGEGTLAAMIASMAATPQPRPTHALVAAFGRFDLRHGFAVNLVVVLALGAIGLALLSGRRPVVRAGLAGAAVLGLADWLLVEDLGVFGGTGTDPNSMVSMLVLLVGGYIAMVRVPAAAIDGPATVTALPARGLRALPARIAANPSFALRVFAAGTAVAIVLLGAAPMAGASLNSQADPIVYQAFDGTPDPTDVPAPPFHLTDQNGHPVSLASLKGKAVAMTFLDPVCTSDCPIIAQEFRVADSMLGANARHVVLVAIVANPLYRSTAIMRDFDRTEGLDHLKNWLFLTGSTQALAAIWNDYGIQVSVEPGGSMVAHSDLAYVIDPRGYERTILSSDPGPATTSTRSSFSGVLSAAITGALNSA